jgi:transcriptional regulator with XRE-family HTH domain
MGALFRLLRQHAGASQMRIAITIGVTTNRVSLIMNGRSAVTALATFERIATGLDMPDDARLTLGIAPHREDR